MAWYAYCISEKQAFPDLLRHRKPVPLEAVTGIAGNQVFLYPASDLAVIVSEHNPEEPLVQKSAVDHGKVIADCFKMSTVLPFRFGTVFPDDEALRRSVRSNQRQFLANLDRLRGKAEMHLKVVVDDCLPRTRQARPNGSQSAKSIPRQPAAKTPPSNANARPCARAVSVQMHRMFAPLDEEITCKRDGAGKMFLDIAHLIDHKCIERQAEPLLHRLCPTERLPGCKLWPPGHALPLRPSPVPRSGDPLRDRPANQSRHPRLGNFEESLGPILYDALFLSLRMGPTITTPPAKPPPDSPKPLAAPENNSPAWHKLPALPRPSPASTRPTPSPQTTGSG